MPNIRGDILVFPLKWDSRIVQFIKCHQCGKCCLAGVITMASKAEVKAIADHLNIKAKEVKERLSQKPCGFLKNDEGNNKSCTIYPQRPGVCMLYPVRRVVELRPDGEERAKIGVWQTCKAGITLSDYLMQEYNLKLGEA